MSLCVQAKGKQYQEKSTKDHLLYCLKQLSIGHFDVSNFILETNCMYSRQDKLIFLTQLATYIPARCMWAYREAHSSQMHLKASISHFLWSLFPSKSTRFNSFWLLCQPHTQFSPNRWVKLICFVFRTVWLCPTELWMCTKPFPSCITSSYFQPCRHAVFWLPTKKWEY